MKRLLDVPSYPLQWPEGWPRHKPHQRQPSPYKVDLVQASDGVDRSLALMGAKWCAISSNVPTRLDGLPYAKYRQPEDPGVAVWWQGSDGEQLVIACDQWRTVRENMRAVGLTLEAYRMIERTGVSEIVKRAMQGLRALPPPASTCWQVLRLDRAEMQRLRPDQARAKVTAVRRQAALDQHPDRGGTPAELARVNAAADEAEREIAQWGNQ